jgi:hypothetical protein
LHFADRLFFILHVEVLTGLLQNCQTLTPGTDCQRRSGKQQKDHGKQMVL